MFDAAEALFFCRCNKFSVLNKAGRGVAVVGVNTKDVRHLLPPLMLQNVP